jgi:hypothetical protein
MKRVPITLAARLFAVTAAKAVDFGGYDFANNQTDNHQFKIEHIFVR